jgi:DNA replication protein DnaC
VSDRCTYGLCDGDGLLFDEATNTAYDCRCRPALLAARKARSLSAVIPRRYRGASFERPPVTEIEPKTTVRATRRFANSITDHLDSGHGLWFMGPVGTGKTTLAILVMKAALDAGRTAARYSLPGLLSEIRTTFDTGSHTMLLEQLKTVDLLVLDDIGAEQTTPWVLEELYSIVNSRYEDRKSMVITTNGVERLNEQITDRTVSRLTEMCDQLPVEGHDRRMGPAGPSVVPAPPWDGPPELPHAGHVH